MGYEMQRHLLKGDRAPDFAFDDPEVGRFSSLDLLRRGPVVLTFWRGAWCMRCQGDFRDLMSVMPEILGARATVIGVLHPLTVDGRKKLIAEYALDFPVFDDEDFAVADAFGIRPVVDLSDEEKEFGSRPLTLRDAEPWIAPMLARFVIGIDGTILHDDIVWDLDSRPNADCILPLLKSAC